jgi:hypothetical protein
LKKYIRFLAITFFAIAGTSTYAHHSFQATFDSNSTIEVEGVVTKFSFKNPHINIYFDVTADDGTVTNWMSEGSAATLMRRSGWSKETIQSGQLIRVTGNSTHDGSPMVSIASVDVLNADDGSVVATLSRNNGGGGRGGNEPAAEKAAAIPLTLADGRPNLSGAWTNHGMRGARPPRPNPSFSDVGAALQASYEIANDPQVFCDPPGLVRQAGTTPHPVRITQYDDRVLIEYEEYGGKREIFFEAGVNAKGIKTHLGDSVARYEGDALIIETNNLLSNPISPDGNRLSDQTTTVQTYRRADSDEYGPVLSMQLVVSDPAYLEEDVVISGKKMSAGEYEFIENDCQQPLRERVAVHAATSFFLTSNGPGDGANLGGLAGADAHCESLSASVGAGGKNWQAYLSTTGEGSVNARDRIGSGPWYDTKGIPVATSVDNLHGEENNMVKATVVDEHGQVVNGRGDEPNRHDILTGSQADGTALNSDTDTSCSNWTGNGEGSALVGHFDRQGGGDNPTSWNSAHPSRGCSQANLQATGGDGLFYCFAAQ